jgi:hypothetical protein
MVQPEYLLYFRWRKPARIFQASELTVEHPEIRKTSYSNLGGFRFGHSTGTARIDRRKLDIRSLQVSSFVFRVAATAEGVKSVLRRIRPQEAEQLDAIDADIGRLQAQLDALRDQRKQALHAAWQRGNVVRLKELEELLPNVPSGDAAH